MPQVRSSFQRWVCRLTAIGCWSCVVAATLAQQLDTPKSLRVVREALDRGKYQEALQDARGALAVTESEYGAGSLEVARVLDVLVEALIAAGQAASDEALMVAERAVELKQRHLRTDTTELAASLDNLGALHTARGEYVKALPLHERVLELLSDNGNEARVADTLERQALPLINLEKFDEARVRLERARGIRERDAEASPLAMAGTLELLAMLHRYRGDFREAQSLIDRALAIRRRLTPEHPAIASMLHIQGDISFLTGDLSSARQTYAAALDMATRTLGSVHPAVSVYSRKLALAEWSFGNSEEARRLRESSVRIAEVAFAPCHPDLANAFSDLALSYRQEGNLVEARSLFERALSRYENCLGRAHSFTATALFNIANVAIAMGIYARLNAC
jgi:tetratricopeptide (TPR) repeat protein